MSRNNSPPWVIPGGSGRIQSQTGQGWLGAGKCRVMEAFCVLHRGFQCSERWELGNS